MRFICLGSNRLVLLVVRFLIYVQSVLKPTDLIFSSPQSGEERSRVERSGAERRGAEKSGAERSGVGRRGDNRSREETRGDERILDGLRESERCGYDDLRNL